MQIRFGSVYFMNWSKLFLGTLINSMVQQKMMRKKRTFFFSKTKKAPGIVVGRMQKEGVIGYNKFNKLKEKYGIAI